MPAGAGRHHAEGPRLPHDCAHRSGAVPRSRRPSVACRDRGPWRWYARAAAARPVPRTRARAG